MGEDRFDEIVQWEQWEPLTEREERIIRLVLAAAANNPRKDPFRYLREAGETVTRLEIDTIVQKLKVLR